jgi:uncharacterized membrane protein YccC
VLGTLIGAAATVAIVPNLVNAPGCFVLSSRSGWAFASISP